ncbi:hypothetical protein FRB96_008281 [Tulasnella sp. 330]|nr:hypothetical protein FRB96_008281 [Tulasnella sp. 330]
MVSYAWQQTKSSSTCGDSWYTYAKGAYLELNFTGVAVWVGGAWSAEGGIINFVLDDGDMNQVDVYAPTTQCNIVWFEAMGLANTTHTLTGTLNANSPENMNPSPGPYMEIISVVYQVLDPGDVISSSSSVSATSTFASTSASTASTASITSATSGSGSTPSAATSDGKGGISATKLAIGLAVALILIALAAFLFVFWRRRYKRRGKSVRHLRGSTDLDGAAMMEPLILPAHHPVRQDSQGEPIEVDVALQNSEPWSPETYRSPSYNPNPESGEGLESAMVVAADGYGYKNGTFNRPPSSSPSSPPIIVTAPSSVAVPRPQSLISTHSDGTTLYPQSSAGGDHSSGSQMSAPSIADTDVDRIAARVALMINNRQSWDSSSGQEPPPEVDWTGGGEFIPPPSYNPKRP